MSIADEIHRNLSSGHSRGPMSFGAKLDEVQRLAGSGRKAAAKVGLGSEATWRRWRSGGTKPTAANAVRLDRALRALWLDPGRADAWRNNAISVTVPEPARSGTRTIGARALRLKDGTGERVVSKWLDVDDVGAARAFVDGIGDPWYHDVMFGEWLDDPDVGADDHDQDYAVGVVGMS